MTIYSNSAEELQGKKQFKFYWDKLKLPAVNDNMPQSKKADPDDDLIVSLGEWAKEWLPPQYIIGRFLQRRFLGVVTGPAGSYKTAVFMRTAVHYALGLPVGDHAVKVPGRVLYFAGENPNEALTRLMALSEEMGFDIDKIEIDVVRRAFAMTPQQVKKLIRKALKDSKEYGLVIIDTIQAYFPGTDANDNPQQLQYALTLRGLTDLPGGPCVIGLAHPSKYGDKTLPYGGGSFYNEIDGGAYLSVINDHNIIKLTHLQKWRSARFEPIAFEAVEYDAPRLRDADGEPIESVTVIPRTSGEVAPGSKKAKDTEISPDELIAVLFEHPGETLTQFLEAMALSVSAKNRGRLDRALQKLKPQGLAEQDDEKHWRLTDAGKALFANKTEQGTEQVKSA